MKSSKLLLIAVIILLFGGRYAFQVWRDGAPKASIHSEEIVVDSGSTKEKPSISYARIVSMAPSITEVLFALGMEAHVVGVTRYCDYPPAALKKSNIGGFLDPNYEAIVALQPDLIVTLPEHKDVRKKLHSFELKTVTVNHRSVSNILESIKILGSVGQVEEASKLLLADFETRMAYIRQRVEGLKKPRVLISIGREVKGGSVRKLTVCGSGTYYEDLIQRAGGVNAYTGKIGYPTISAEGLLTMAPDLIIDLVPDLAERKLEGKDVEAEWDLVLGMLPEKKCRVRVLGGGHLTVPGPRFILLLETLAHVFHPSFEPKSGVFHPSLKNNSGDVQKEGS